MFFTGQPIAYDPSWNGPVKGPRRKTDPLALKFYCIFLIIWLGVGGIYGKFHYYHQFCAKNKY